MNRNVPIAVGLSALLAASLLSGCATSTEKPTRSLTRAESFIEVAADQGAQQYAAAALERARDKLQQANRAADKGENEVAMRLATEAELDAQLATAQTNRLQAEQSLREVQESLDTLRRETTAR
ncbi:MAG: DUF4398 domain-containing protein [Halioglobus sp.]|nr:DUF4398 domain-containing protein [Halioglobus sp.]